MSDGADRDTRVLVLAPAGRDAELARRVLANAGIASAVCRDFSTFCEELELGAAAGILTEEALPPEHGEPLREVLKRQPPWSDFPLVVLAGRAGTGGTSEALRRALVDLGNTTLLERPLSQHALVGIVRGALRARLRQYQARELMSRLEQGVKERDRFLAILSHELRNPLGAMRNAVHVAQRGLPQGSELARPVAIVDRQITHLARLMDDLLDVSRVTTGKVVLQRRRLDLRAVIQQSLQQLAQEFEKHGLHAFSALGARPLWVDGDPVRLEQVVTNLLMNAIKYTPKDGRVELTAGTTSNGVWARFLDTGIGIEPEMLPRIFELFTQVDRTLDRAQGGMGIGLTLVKSLVELHGGAVAAKSPGLGKGSEFTLHFPGAAPPAPALTDTTGGPTIARTLQRVLLVDDSEDNREMLRDLLEMDGFEVQTSVDGPTAVEHALRWKPDVAIVDIGLPIMDGYDVARRVRSVLGPRIRLVALTGYGQPEDHQRTAEAGFDAHLTKPVNIADLEAVIRPPT